MRIAENKKAFYDYSIEDRYEAGIVLEGWEVKAIRNSKVQITEAYVVVCKGEIFLFGAHISALPTASNHIHSEVLRTRKLLLKKAEIVRIIGKINRSGYTIVPLDIHVKDSRIKCMVGLAKGKTQHDKREAEKNRDGMREVQVAMKQIKR
jgi:SsrA-binding protein